MTSEVEPLNEQEEGQPQGVHDEEPLSEYAPMGQIIKVLLSGQ